MTTYSIEIGATSKSSVGDLLDVAGGSSFQVIDANNFSLVSNGSVVLKAVQAAFPIDHSNYGVIESAGNCVSDSNLMSSTDAFAPLLPDANMEHAVDLNTILTAEDQGALGHLSQHLLASLPDVSKGLAGELSGTELTALIGTLQTQLLELNQATTDLFGSLADEVDHAVNQVGEISAEDLISSAQVDASTLADYSGSMIDHDHAGLSSGTTLDALFTHPESFPLTMDFSDPSIVDQNAELFASSSGSSISSSASEGDSGLDSSSFGGSGFDHS